MLIYFGQKICKNNKISIFKIVMRSNLDTNHKKKLNLLRNITNYILYLILLSTGI